MHTNAFNYVAQFATNEQLSVVEIGSRNLNGTVKSLFPNAKWVGLDLYAGPDVDVVADAEFWNPPQLVDMVVCCEVLEHAPNWKELIVAASRWLKPGGRFIMTCAGPGRHEHSAIDGATLKEGEYYGNLSWDAVEKVAMAAGFIGVVAKSFEDDTQMVAVKDRLEPPKLKIGLDLEGVLYAHPVFFRAMIEAMTAAGHEFFCTAAHGRDEWSAVCKNLLSLGISPDSISPDLLYPHRHGHLTIKAATADKLDVVFDGDDRVQNYTKTPLFKPLGSEYYKR